jgi:hypothetical protein
MDNFGFEKAVNEIDDQTSGFNAQANEDDPRNNMQGYKYEVVSF